MTVPPTNDDPLSIHFGRFYAQHDRGGHLTPVSVDGYVIGCVWTQASGGWYNNRRRDVYSVKFQTKEEAERDLLDNVEYVTIPVAKRENAGLPMHS